MYIAADISADTTACYLSRLELKQLLQEHSAFFPSFFHEIDAVTVYHNSTSGLTHATCSIGPHADPTDTQGFPNKLTPLLICRAWCAQHVVRTSPLQPCPGHKSIMQLAWKIVLPNAVALPALCATL